MNQRQSIIVKRHDKVGNLQTINYQHSTNNFSYDSMNRLTTMVDGIGATSYSYDSAGQLLSEGGPWPDNTVTYSYANHLRTGLRVQAPNASDWVQSYTYDSIRHLSTIASPAGTFGYDYWGGHGAPPGSIVQQLNLPKGAYDKIGQLTNAAGYDYDGTPQSQKQFTYSYDRAGNLSNRVENLLTNFFTVNSLNELSNSWRRGSMTVAGTTTSAATNVTVNALTADLYSDNTFARTNVSLADGTNTFTAIATDSYGRWDTNISVCYLSVSNAFVYDLNGNLRTNGNQTLEYDDENQLTSITVSNQWRSEFVYDGKMRRRIRKEFTWLSAITNWLLTSETRYIYDGMLVVQERDGNNLPAVTYTRGRDLSGTLQGAGGIGGLLARTDMHLSTLNSPLSTSFYHCDANGNVTCLINASNAVVARYEYDPFGNTISASGPLAEANLYRFSSKELNGNSGTYYYGYRFYSPNLQRWLNRDPLNENGFELLHGKRILSKTAFVLVRYTTKHIATPNLYIFVAHQPLNFLDAFGLDAGTVVEILFPPSLGGNDFNCGLVSETSPIQGDPTPGAGNRNGQSACIWRCNSWGDQIPSVPNMTVVTFTPPGKPCPLPKASCPVNKVPFKGNPILDPPNPYE